MVKSKIFVFFMLGLFMISFSSALEFDNAISDYNETTETITFSNGCLFDIGWTCMGSEIGKVQLKTPKDFHVARGYNYVWELDVWVEDDYNDFLKGFEFEDLNKGQEKINRDIDIKILSYEDVEVYDYENVLIGTSPNGTDIYEHQVVGSHIELQEVWAKVSPADIKKADGKVTLRGYTDVQGGDKIDWSPLIFGVRVSHDIWAVWTEDLNVGLTWYGKLDDNLATTVVIDSTGANNGALVGGDNTNAISVAGKISTALHLDGVNDRIDTNTKVTGLSDFSVAGWVNYDTNLASSNTAIGNDAGGFDQSFRIRTTGAGGEISINVQDGSSTQTDVASGITISTGTWYHVAYTKEGTNHSLYVDGAYKGSTILAQTPNSNDLTLGARDDASEKLDGILDEWAIYTRTISQSEITQLYNGGDGITYTDAFGIGITLNSPEDDLSTQNQTIIFNTTISKGNLEITNVSLLINGVINETNTSGTEGVYIFEKDLEFGIYNWSIQVVDNETNTTSSDTRDIFILDGSAAAIWTDEYQVRIIAANLTESDFEINNLVITQEGDNLWKINTTEGDDEVARAQVMKTFFYGTNGNNPRINRTTGLLKIQTQDGRDVDKRGINVLSRWFTPADGPNGLDGSYIGTFSNTENNFNVSSWSLVSMSGDIHSYWYLNGSILNDVASDSSNNELGTDTVADQKDNPLTAHTRISPHGPAAHSSTGTVNVIILSNGSIDWVESNFDGDASNTDFTINESIPAISPIPNITLNAPENNFEELQDTPIIFNSSATINEGTLNEITLYINGVLNETKSLSGTEDTETFTKSFSTLGNYNWSVEVCDINDNCALSETRDFTIFPFSVVDYTYDTNITEGEANTISVEILVNDGSSLTDSTLNYDGINYTTSVIFSNNTYFVASNVNAPLVTSDTNISFNFYLTVDGITYQLQSIEQEILNLDFDICGGLSNDTLLNMSLFDEETLTNISGTIEVNANIISKTSEEIVATANGTFSDVNYGAICFSPVSSYDLYYLDTEIRYFSNGYATEFYYIQKADMANYPTNLSLFDLNQNDSTEFSVTYKNNAFIFTEGAIIQLQRKYIGDDIYEVVEAPITGDGGEAVLHIDLNTNKYRASVVKDGELLDFFDNIVFNCDNELSGDCTHSLDGTVDPNNDIPIEDITDFTYSISIDEDNQTVTVLFAVPSGTPSTINVALDQIDMFGNFTSCNTTIITSAGSITCDYVDTIEKSILELSISKNDVQLAIFSYVNDPELDMDGMNFFIVFLFMISLVGMAISSPEWMIIISVMVLLISGTLLLLSGMNLVMGLGAIAWVVVAAAIIILKMAKQEDR